MQRRGLSESMHFPPPHFRGEHKKKITSFLFFSPPTFSPPKFTNSMILGGNRFCSPPKLGGNSDDFPPEWLILGGKRPKSVPPNFGGKRKKKWQNCGGEIREFPPHNMRGVFPPAIRASFPKSRILEVGGTCIP